jgi:hypothetical protein
MDSRCYSLYKYVGCFVAIEMWQRKAASFTERLVDSDQLTRTRIPQDWNQRRRGKTQFRVNPVCAGRQVEWAFAGYYVISTER